MGELALIVLFILFFVALFFIIFAVNMGIQEALNFFLSDDDSSYGLMLIDSLLITILLVGVMSPYLI